MTIIELYELDPEMAEVISKYVIRRNRTIFHRENRGTKIEDNQNGIEPKTSSREVHFISEVRVNKEFSEILEEANSLKTLYKMILSSEEDKIKFSEACRIARIRKEEGKSDGVEKWYELFP